MLQKYSKRTRFHACMTWTVLVCGYIHTYVGACFSPQILCFSLCVPHTMFPLPMCCMDGMESPCMACYGCDVGSLDKSLVYAPQLIGLMNLQPYMYERHRMFLSPILALLVLHFLKFQTASIHIKLCLLILRLLDSSSVFDLMSIFLVYAVMTNYSQLFSCRYI